MPLITSVNDLVKILESRVARALELSRQEIYDVIKKYIDKYYTEPVFGGRNIPAMYRRTYQLLESLIKTDIIRDGSYLTCKVQIDPDYLNYTYPGNSEDPQNAFNPATGLDVMNWANEGLHGGTVSGNLNIWDDAIEELGGEAGIMDIVRRNMKACGVPIQ